MLGFPKGAITNFVVRKRQEARAAVLDCRRRGRASTTRSRAARARTAPKVEIDGDDIAFLQYTGGTTGVAKGAMLTHRNMVANMLQALAWIGPNMREGEEIVVTALPLYHIFALTANLLVFARVGGYNHLITNPRDMPAFVKAIAKITLHGADRRQHAVRGPAQHAGLRQGRFLAPAPDARRRHGRAARGRGPLEESHRLHARRSLRPHRNRARGLHQSARHSRNTTARSACRSRRPRSRSRTTTARRCRSARSASFACAARRS